MKLDYDIVIATRNRARILELSIPTFLSQDHPPRRLIVVDASEQHEPVRTAVENAASGFDVEVVVLHEPQPSTSRQRNVGLQHVAAPITMFPDDDVLWYPGAAHRVMEVYRRDADERIGGVAFDEARVPPEGVLPATPAPTRRSLSERFIYRFSPLRAALENLVCPNPMVSIGSERLDEHPAPDWFKEADVSTVPFLLGYRMSFRTDVVRRIGFDETLSRYALYEDFDLSLEVLRSHMLVHAGGAKLFHHRAPGTRDQGTRTGLILLLNLAYVTCKQTPVGSRQRRAIRRYALMRMGQYLPRCSSQFGRDRLRGLRRAYRVLPELIETPPDRLSEAYSRLIRGLDDPEPADG